MSSQAVGRTVFFPAIALAACFLLPACGRGEAAHAAAVDCPAIAGVPDAPLLLFGEMHGSQETPVLIHAVACHVSASEDVAVGLEMASEDQPLLDAFMAGNGTADDVQKLLASDFWQMGGDGRSSMAMLGLIEDLRALKQAGRPVALFAFDDQPGTKLERNVAIANGLRRFHGAHPNVRIIALTGNVHAMQESMWAGETMLTPSGKLLADLHPVSVFVSYPAGTIWACTPACGVQTLKAARGEATPGFHAGSPMGGYSRTYRLASITASPPAVKHGL